MVHQDSAPCLPPAPLIRSIVAAEIGRAAEEWGFPPYSPATASPKGGLRQQVRPHGCAQDAAVRVLVRASSRRATDLRHRARLSCFLEQQTKDQLSEVLDRLDRLETFLLQQHGAPTTTPAEPDAPVQEELTT